MDTSEIPLLLRAYNFEESKLADGSRRLLADSDKLKIEILPGKSVSMFLGAVDKDVLAVVDFYIKDQKKSLDVLREAAKHAAASPNTTYRQMIAPKTILSVTKIQATDASFVSLSIEEGELPEDVF
jgi:hypothetical protein